MLNRGKSKFLLTLVLFLALFVNSLPAMETADHISGKNGAKIATPEFFKGVKKEITSNGLTIITLVREDSPLVSINFFINTGSINESERNSGVSHFCEHMFYRGADQKSSIQIKSDIENLGGDFNAETTRDYTRFYVNVPSVYGLEALKIYCQALLESSYNKAQIEQERKVILEEYNLSSQNPAVMLQEKIYSMAYPKHPYGRPIIGTESTINSLNQDDLLNYKERWYKPETITIVIVGNFDREKYVGTLKEYFGKIPGSSPEGPTSYPSLPLKEPKECFEEKVMDSTESYFVIGFRSPGICDRNDVVAMDVLVFMLGQGKDSVLNRELHQNKNLVEQIESHYFTSKDPSLVLFITKVAPVSIENVKESILALLSQVKNGEFSDEDLKKAKKMLLNGYVYGVQTNDGKADSLGFYNLFGDFDMAVEYSDMVKKVSRDDLIRVANKYFGADYVLYAIKPGKPKKRW